MQFITVRVRNAITVHGYTDDNEEIVERFENTPYADKLIAVSRIQSVSEQFILVTGSHGRLMYWEYEGDLDSITERLAQAGLVCDAGRQS